MMQEIEKTKKISTNLKNFYLDPNNYRFVDHKDYKKIADKDVLDLKIQQRTLNFISGKNREGIKDLLDSFRANGFLEVDVIQLKDLDNNKYLVLEGNRRVTALKALKEDYEQGLDIGKFNPDIFKKVPSFIHNNEDDTTHRIIMGLKHISGNKKWPAINQAQLIYDYLEPYSNEEYYEEETKLCESLGITKVKLRNSQRAYYLILQYKDSDYGDQFNSDMYSTFAEITKRPTIKKWIEWNNSTYKAENEENILRLFSWLSEREESDNEIEDEEIEDYKKCPPIITKSIEVRDLAKFIYSEKALEVMEEENSVAQGLVASGSIEQESFEKSIKELNKQVGNLDRLKDLISFEDMEKLKKINKTFLNLLPKESSVEIQSENVSVCFAKGRIQHFDSLFIEKYKVFKDFKIDRLNRINIFAGFNNTGKTTLLEAIYLLTKQNNIGAFFELIKLKNKLTKLNTHYLNNYFQEEIKIIGNFNEIKTLIEFKKFEAGGINKKDDYLSSYEVISTIDGEKLNNIIHTFESSPLIRYVDRVEILCNSLFKSPYFYNQQEIINTHSKNVELKVFDMVIKFITNHIDKDIQDIDLTEQNDIKRFLVDSKIFPEKSVDITSYGEGLQRIFEIALAFAYCKNGVLLIDELETAIHYSLLVDFTKFIQELAIKFNVQVFITSHSKECIDAFVDNDVHNEDISAYLLENKNNKISTKYVGGDRLKYLIENIGLDIRGNQNG
jgi:AAA15 family ATPase/GTPase